MFEGSPKKTETDENNFPVFSIEMPGIDEAPDSNCMQASIEMVLKDLEGDGAPTLEELNEASHKREGMGTWPGWIVSWIKDRGYDVELLSNVDWKRFVEEGEDYLESDEFKEKHTTEGGNGDDLVKYIKRHVVDDGIASTQEMLDRDIVVERDIDLSEILERVQNGERAIALIDGDHYVPITGFDGENVLYNNASEKSVEINKKKSLDRFLEKWHKYNLNTIIFIKK